MTTYQFKDWPLWFVLEVENGKLVRLEEHDIREGGGIKADAGKSLEETFIAHASDRIKGSRAEAEQFLADCLSRTKSSEVLPVREYRAVEDEFNELVTQNIILKGDSYKHSHYLQYPDDMTTMYSYIESRGGRFDKLVFFGLQMFIKRYLLRPITQRQIDYAAKLAQAHAVPFNREGWEYILREFDGYLPLTIKAPKEGTVIDAKNVLTAIQNNGGKPTRWLTSFIETPLLRAIWYPVTVASGSWAVKQEIKTYLERTSDDPYGQLPFKLHDFGARAATSSESAAIGGLAHLVNFMGTDTVEAIPYGQFFYGSEMAGFSIPAAEHSTMTSWGRNDEIGAYRNMLKQFAKPGSLVAVVSDSYDIFNAVENIWGKELRDEVIASGATVIIRPDSGDPIKTPQKVIELLDKAFGHTTNSKGYKVLNNVRVIQGDGVDIHAISTILGDMTVNGWAADNIAFGMGGKLLQADIDRDTQKFAMKASAALFKIAPEGDAREGTFSAMHDEEWRDVFKDPITDPGKKSKRGRLALVRDGDGYKTVGEGAKGDLLEVVYENGKLVRDQTLDEIRKLSEERLTTWAPPKKVAA